MRRLLRIALGLLGLALCACAAERVPLSPAGPDHAPLLLAFRSDRPPSLPFSPDVLLYDLRGNGPPVLPANVVTTSILDQAPCALSGNARLMAYHRTPEINGPAVFLYDIATRTLLPPPLINQFTSPQSPSLSGDGRFLGVQHQLSGNPFDLSVAVEDLVADSLLALPSLNDSTATNFDPSLNGDGSLVAFASNRIGGSGDFDIYLYSVPGDSLIPLPGLNSTARDLSASISADGRYIAFQSGRPSDIGLINVYLYDRVTASLVPLPTANDTLSEVQPAISPDGRYLAYATESQGGRDVWVYDIRARRRLRIEGLNDPYYYDYFPALANLP